MNNVIARDTYDTVRIIEIEHGIDDVVLFTSSRTGHVSIEESPINYVQDEAFFMDGEVAIMLSDLVRADSPWG